MAFTFDDAGNGIRNAEVGETSDAFGAVNLPGNGGAGDSGSGDVDAFGTVFDPELHSGRDKFNSDGSYRKRRGRKPGSARPSTSRVYTKKTDYSASVDALSNTLMIVHAGIASVTKVNELTIDKTESDALATALANVLSEFDIAPDPKVQAIVGLVVTAGTIYGPRMYLYNERMKAAKKKPASLHVLNPGGASVDMGETVS